MKHQLHFSQKKQQISIRRIALFISISFLTAITICSCGPTGSGRPYFKATVNGEEFKATIQEATYNYDASSNIYFITINGYNASTKKSINITVYKEGSGHYPEGLVLLGDFNSSNNSKYGIGQYTYNYTSLSSMKNYQTAGLPLQNNNDYTGQCVLKKIDYSNYKISGTFSFKARLSVVGTNPVNSYETVNVSGDFYNVKLEPGSGVNNPSSNTPGTVTFWTKTNFQCGPITINIGGTSKTLNTVFGSNVTSCGVSGAANFSLAAGTYNYSASCSSKSWTGTVTVNPGGCYLNELTQNQVTQTRAMVWTNKDFGCGVISVTINGQTKSITSYYSINSQNNPPACGASGCATFDLSPGSYNVSASCSGRVWNQTINVTSGQCFRLILL